MTLLKSTNLKKELVLKLQKQLISGTCYSGHAAYQIGEVDSLFDSKARKYIDDAFLQDAMSKLEKSKLSFLEKMLFLDLKYRIPDDLLTRLDRMTMAASVEGRVPFLDHHFVETSLRVKPNHKIKNNERKYLMKKISEQHIPREIIYRKKSGFPVPTRSWLKSEHKNKYVGTILKNCTGIFDQPQLEKTVNDHYDNGLDNTILLWRLFFLTLWYKKWFLNLSIGEDI